MKRCSYYRPGVGLATVLAGLCVLPRMAIEVRAQARASDDRPVTIFSPASADAVLPPPRDYVVRQRGVQIDLAALAGARPNRVLVLDLFDDLTFDGQVQWTKARPDGGFTVGGRFEGQAAAHFNLAVEGDALAGTVLIPQRQVYAQIRFVSEGLHVVQLIATDKMPPCGGSPAQPAKYREPSAAEPADVESPAETGGSDAACVATQTTFDVLGVYTDVARAAAGGTNAIRAILQVATDDANVFYYNSAIDAHVRMVARREVTYNESGTYNDHLNRITNGSDGFMDVVHTWRSDFSADAVMLYVDDGEYCGLAWCCSDAGGAFGVTTWYCGSFVFAHEFGHNQGCAHNVENVDCTGCQNYARGHHYVGNNAVEYGTVMSYIGQQFGHFSNPSISFAGFPTGIANQRDNARMINERRNTVAGFRTTHFEVWVDFNHGGGENGTFGSPFNTFAEGYNFLVTADNPTELPSMWIKSSNTNATATISKPMVIRACNGPVRIGQ